MLKEEDIYGSSRDLKTEMQQSDNINQDKRSKSPIANNNTNQSKI